VTSTFFERDIRAILVNELQFWYNIRQLPGDDMAAARRSEVTD
jgi:hypothetical protein